MMSIMFFLLGLILVLLLIFYKKNKQITPNNQEMIQQNTSLNLATRIGGIGIWYLNVKTNCFTWNDLMYEIYYIPQGTPITFNLWQKQFHPEDKERIEIFFEDANQSTQLLESEFRILLSNGETRFIKASAILDKYTNIVMGTNIDITQQRQATDALELEKEKLNSIIAGANVGTWEWHVQQGEEIINERWAEIIGYTIAELSPVSIHTWEKFCHPDDLARALDLLQKHFDRKIDSYACDIRMKHKQGHWVWVHTRGKVAKWSADNKPLHMFGTHQDITLRKENEDKIYRQANYDLLTGLASRQLVNVRLTLTMEMAKRHKKHVAILFIDLNKFKSVNDNYGHDVGDHLLKEVARRIRTCIRQNDTASRVGGDEFIVVLSELQNKMNVQRVAKAILHQMSQPILINEIAIEIGISIGISAYPDDAEDQVTLIKLADEAMYKIKKTGKSDYGFA